jgi:hypothetical protein
MSNYDYRPDLEEMEKIEEKLKEKIEKLPKEEEDDSIRDD